MLLEILYPVSKNKRFQVMFLVMSFGANRRAPLRTADSHTRHPSDKLNRAARMVCTSSDASCGTRPISSTARRAWYAPAPTRRAPPVR
ncbi:hypothetical protein HanRHA438_Chr11g0484371 [Helianthus annuus]|nr:hypothetical protein HanRHA438_Chr11g0484371 [Helianthus annuus]